MPIKYYQPINVPPIEGTSLPEYPDDDKGEPFKKGLKPEETRLDRISPLHVRSFENTEISGNVLWGDEYSIKYMGRSTKGVPPKGEIPWIEEDNYTKSGVRTHYLCDEIDARNTVAASKMLRNAGIPTERIVRTVEIQELSVRTSELLLEDWDILKDYGIGPLDAKDGLIKIPIQAIKQIMILNLDLSLNTIKTHFGSELPDLVKKLSTRSPQEIEKIKKHILDTSYYYYERDMPVNERCLDLDMAESLPEVSCFWDYNGSITFEGRAFSSLRDFTEYAKSPEVQNRKDTVEVQRLCEILTNQESSHFRPEAISSDVAFRKILSSAFTYLNMAEGYSLDINNPQDVALYYSEILPKKMGETLGKIHNLGLIHKFPGDKNWLTVGYLVDLDSVSGEPLGDAPITIDQMHSDVTHTFSCLYCYSFGGIPLSGQISNSKQHSQYTFYGHVVQLVGIEQAEIIETQAENNFFKAYIDIRGDGADWLKDRIS